jgi:hypothetical protein
MPLRREALDTYLRSVTNDLFTRGALRASKGASLETILKTEPLILAQAVQEDFKTVGLKIAFDLATTAMGLVEGIVHKEVGNFVSRLFETKRR